MLKRYFVLFSLLFSSCCMGVNDSQNNEPQEISQDMLWRDAVVTVYNPTDGQCDDTPLITASCRVIDLDQLRDGNLRWCALSRDLLEYYPYGTEIELYISPDHEFNGKWLVADTMNRRFTNHIDLLTYDRRYGKWVGKIK